MAKRLKQLYWRRKNSISRCRQFALYQFRNPMRDHWMDLRVSGGKNLPCLAE